MTKPLLQTLTKYLAALSVLSLPAVESLAAPTTPYGTFCSIVCGYESPEEAGISGWAYFSRITANPELYSYAGVQRYIPPEWEQIPNLVDPYNIRPSTASNQTTYWWMYNYKGTQVAHPAYVIAYRAYSGEQIKAAMAADVYTGCTTQHGYQCNRHTTKYGYAANVYQEGNKYVIAVRGTDNSNFATYTYNLLSDTSFSAGEPNQGLINAVQQVSELVADIKAKDASADISLTGHSLGGAIAQIVASAEGLSADTFNAPGAGKIVANYPDIVTTNLKPGSVVGAITNYRLYGDQVSNAGTNVPGVQVVTISNENYMGVANFLDYHKIEAMQEALTHDGNRTEGSAGLNIVPTLVLPGVIGLTPGSWAASSWEVIINVADKVASYFLDPPPGWKFSLVASTQSPGITSMILPTDAGVYGWNISAFDGVVWSPYFLSGSDGINFGKSVYAVDFNPVDDLLQDMLYKNPFVIGMNFDSEGTFNGSLLVASELNRSHVPEPNILLVFVLGIGVLLLVRKLK